MLSLALYLCLSLMLELIVRRALCKVLDMTSVPLFLLLWFCCFAASFIMQQVGFNPVARAVIVNVLANLTIPLVMSRGPIGQRLTRIAFINVVVLLTEIAGTLVYLILRGHPFPSSIAETDPLTIVLVYTILTCMATVTCEATIAFFRRADDSWDEDFEPAAFIMMASSFVFFIMLLVRFDLNRVKSATVAVVTGIGAILNVLISLSLLRIARQDAQAKREIALQVAKRRQIKHLMEEVERVTNRSVGMRHLRHDLANQIGVVRALADQGRLAEADEYLSGLQDFAHSIAGSQSCEAKANHE